MSQLHCSFDVQSVLPDGVKADYHSGVFVRAHCRMVSVYHVESDLVRAIYSCKRSAVAIILCASRNVKRIVPSV
jgi:hypothetical protein